MNKKLIHDKFLKKLWEKNEHYKNGDFEVLSLEKYPFVRVLTKYGECLPRRGDLLKGNSPTIKSAVNKDEYCVNQFKEKRTFLYDYSLLEYVNQKEAVKIICDKHGVFEQTPDSHKKGIGCPRCGYDKNKVHLSEIKRRLEKSTVEKYYLRGDETLSSHILFTCNLRHEYEQKIVDKLNGNGCPICANITRALYFEKNTNNENAYKIEHYLYLFKIGEEDFSFYKIGAAKNIKRRISYLKKDLVCDVEVLYSKKMSVVEAYRLEALYIKLFKEFRYHHPTNFGGVTECFTINVVELLENMNSYSEEDKITRDKLFCKEYGVNYEQQFNKY
jgi:hypothetical protein